MIIGPSFFVTPQSTKTPRTSIKYSQDLINKRRALPKTLKTDKNRNSESCRIPCKTDKKINAERCWINIKITKRVNAERCWKHDKSLKAKLTNMRTEQRQKPNSVMFALFETEWSLLRQKRVNTYLLFKIGKANF